MSANESKASANAAVQDEVEDDFAPGSEVPGHTFGMIVGRVLVRVLPTMILALALAASTWALGWWTVPVLGFAAGIVLARHRFPGLTGALAGALAWGGILVVESLRRAPIVFWAGRVGSSIQVPGAVLIAMTVLLPALLAGAAAYLGGVVRGKS